MSLIKDCQICGEKVSFRKMRHGKYVCFEVKTNNKHIHTKAEIDKIKNKNESTQKAAETKTNNDLNIIDAKEEKKIIEIKEKDFSRSEKFEDYEETNSEDIFKDDTVKSLRKEIDVETTNKKTNKLIIYVAIVVLIVIVLFFMNG